MNVTLKDIAKLAGVDAGAVSRTLRHHPEALKLREDTRARILKVAKELGYQCNLLASSTRTGIVNTIAIICNFGMFRNAESVNIVLSGVMSEIRKYDYSIKVFPEDEIEKTFDVIVGNRISKVISMSVPRKKRSLTARLAEKFGLDLVFIYERGERAFPAVNVDNFMVAELAVRHLALLGHSRIAMLGEPFTGGLYYIRDRYEGFLSGMKSFGLKIDKDIVTTGDNFEEAAVKLLSYPERKRPSAIFATTDVHAAIVQKVAFKMGLTVPDDLSVIGIGNSYIVLNTAIIPLTTIEESLHSYGTISVDILLKRDCGMVISDHNVYKTIPQLIVRESTGPYKK